MPIKNLTVELVDDMSFDTYYIGYNKAWKLNVYHRAGTVCRNKALDEVIGYLRTEFFRRQRPLEIVTTNIYDGHVLSKIEAFERSMRR